MFFLYDAPMRLHSNAGHIWIVTNVKNNTMHTYSEEAQPNR